MHAFEYGAQTAAAHGGLRARTARTIAPPGYFAALLDGRLHVTRLNYMTRLFGDAASTVYKFVLTAAAVLVAAAGLPLSNAHNKCAEDNAR